MYPFDKHFLVQSLLYYYNNPTKNMIYSKTTTKKDLIKILDQKYNWCMGWRSTVYTQEDLEKLADALDMQLHLRMEDTEDGQVSKYDFEIILETVRNFYEGFVELKTA